MLFRYSIFFSTLKSFIGVGGALKFLFSYTWSKYVNMRKGGLGAVSFGNYTFQFPSAHEFMGLFKEVYINESYYLERSNEALEIIDCGANIGVSLLYIKTRVPNARVTCFEPNPAAREILQKNIQGNSWESTVTVYPFAMGSSEGNVDFYVEENTPTGGGGSLTTYLSSKKRTLKSFEVPIRMLSSYITKKIDFLKIDTEGAELDILTNLVQSGTIDKIQRIQLEYHYNPEYFKQPVSVLLTLLESAGFKTFVEATIRPHLVIDKDISHQCMVFAWRS